MADSWYNYRDSDGTWHSDIKIGNGYNYPCGVEDLSGVCWSVLWDEANKDGDDKSAIHLFKSEDDGENWSDCGVIQTGLLAQTCGIEIQILTQ